jgi:hypothetical protein
MFISRGIVLLLFWNALLYAFHSSNRVLTDLVG